MTLPFHLAHTLPAALSLLPKEMDTPEARILLLAIGLQESKFRDRLQIGGPARGFWQFEKGGGVAGVLSHPASAKHAATVCAALTYPATPSVVHQAIADNDVLACACARLLLWTLPKPMARTATEGWLDYLDAWRPGKPHPETWAAHYEAARIAVAS